MNAFIVLAFSIMSEVFGSSMLKLSNGFKRLLPTIGLLIGYGLAFYGLGLALKTIPLSAAYAIWSGLGTALTAVIGIMIFKEKFNRNILIGILLIILGVILLNID